tara:strand:- start:331 stop:606 length:276 start_codon:yes stop_codon:yes gene_type:complete
MLNLQEVLEFIKNSEREDLNSIVDQINIRKSELRYEIKSSFRVGDAVTIVHKKMDPSKIFRITKINSKNIKVAENDGFGRFTVSPSLLKKA